MSDISGNQMHNPLHPDLAISRFSREPFTRTDAMFNIESYGVVPGQALDVIAPDGVRLLVVLGRGTEVESEIREKVGNQSVFQLVQQEGLLSLYYIPRGTLPLARVLESAPYGAAYMQRLERQAAEIIERLRAHEADAFGVTMNNFAFTYDGPADSTPPIDYNILAIIPPVN